MTEYDEPTNQNPPEKEEYDAAEKERNEATATKFRAETRDGEHGPEGTKESLLRTANMLDTWSKDLYPANALGQVDFARALMESSADEIRAFLASR